MGETILELQNIAKHFGDTDVLNGISTVSYTHLTLPTIA